MVEVAVCAMVGWYGKAWQVLKEEVMTRMRAVFAFYHGEAFSPHTLMRNLALQVEPINAVRGLPGPLGAGPQQLLQFQFRFHHGST